MSRLFQFFVVLSFVSAASISAAKADIVFWKDQQSGASLSYPDTWEKVNNQKPDDILTIAAPLAAGDMAERTQCRLRVRADKRFAIYPAGFAENIQRTYVSRDFWIDYASEFQDTRIDDMRDNAFLGHAPAGYALMTFEPDNQQEDGFRVTKRAMILASQHENNLYVFECSAQVHYYHTKWEKTFRAIANSVSLPQVATKAPHGGYRNFLKEKTLKIHGNGPLEHYYY